MGQILEDAVQPLKWYEELPRAQYQRYEEVKVSQDWFAVYKIDVNVYAIYEDGHFQEVISYLITGTQRCLLLDTGLGIGNMKDLCEELTDKEIIVVNSHCHFDHIGCNHRFDEVYIYNVDVAVNRLNDGMPKSEVLLHLRGDSTNKAYPEGFDPSEYKILPTKKVIPISDGHIFDLGDRQLKVIHTPGHSPDSIMLYDEDNSIMYTGDTFYPATLYAHLTSSDNVTSVFDIYLNTMKQLANDYKVDKLYCSHNYPVVEGNKLTDIAQAFEDIENGSSTYKIDKYGLKKHDFDGFSIVTK